MVNDIEKLNLSSARAVDTACKPMKDVGSTKKRKKRAAAVRAHAISATPRSPGSVSEEIACDDRPRRAPAPRPLRSPSRRRRATAPRSSCAPTARAGTSSPTASGGTPSTSPSAARSSCS